MAMLTIEFETWLEQQRSTVIEYLISQKISPELLSESPAFALAPHLVIWTVSSDDKKDIASGWILNVANFTEYICGEDINSPRRAIVASIKKWQKLLRSQGASQNFTSATQVKWLRSQLKILARCLKNRELWQNETVSSVPLLSRAVLDCQI